MALVSKKKIVDSSGKLKRPITQLSIRSCPENIFIEFENIEK